MSPLGFFSAPRTDTVAPPVAMETHMVILSVRSPSVLLSNRTLHTRVADLRYAVSLYHKKQSSCEKQFYIQQPFQTFLPQAIAESLQLGSVPGLIYMAITGSHCLVAQAS